MTCDCGQRAKSADGHSLRHRVSPHKPLLNLAVLAVAVGLAACASGGGNQPGARAPSATVPAADGPALAGPKRVVAVGKFDAIGSFTAQYGNWDIGGGLAAMLDSELAKSGQFIVVERAYVQQLLSEQQLKANGIAAPETGPRLGQLSGAQYLVYGAVTEFGTEDSGGGFSVGAGRGPLSALIGTKSTSGAVAMDIRVVDTTTGKIVQTVKVKEDLSSTDLSFSGGYQGISLGSDQFSKTPLGEATRRAIDHAVLEIAGVTQRQAWQGQVVAAEGKEIIINAGQSSGIKVGDHFFVERLSERLTDPQTGEVLSIKRERLGSVEVTNVEEKIATGSYAAATGLAPKRGDVVLMSQ